MNAVANVAAQLGLIDEEALPVVGAEASQQIPEPRGPLNRLVARAQTGPVEGDQA